MGEKQTWPSVLQKLSKLPVENYGRRRRTIDTLLHPEVLDLVRANKDSFFVFQIGIVDAAPRIFSKKERNLLKSKWIPATIREYIIQYRRSRRLQITARDPLKKVYTRPEVFGNTLSRFGEFLEKIKVPTTSIYFVPLLGCFDILKHKASGYEGNIQLYNTILHQFCKTRRFQLVGVDKTLTNRCEHFCNDGYHLNVNGNESLAFSTFDSISRIISI